MSALAKTLGPADWLREVNGGVVGSMAVLAIVLTLGLLAYAPLGASAAAVGIPAAFATVGVSSLLFALLAGSAMPTGSPSSATAIIVAGLVALLMRDPLWRAESPDAIVVIVAATSATVVLMGLWQVLLAALGLANLAKHVPQPVLAGFMNAVAVLILVAQLPLLAGLSTEQWSGGWQTAWAQVQPATVAIGLVTAGLIWGLARLAPRVPAPLVAMAAGTLLYHLIAQAWPHLPLGATAGAISGHVPTPTALGPLRDGSAVELLLRHAETIVFTSMLLAVIGTIESMLAALALDQQLNTRHEPRRVLMAAGLANMVGGCFGGLPMVVVRARAQAIVSSGGRSARAVVIGSLFMGLLLAFGSPLLALLPKTVLAGIMVTVAFALLDAWTHELLRRLGAGDRSIELLQSLAMVAVVCGTILWLGFVAGGAVGIVLALVSFIQRMKRSLLRRRFTGKALPSRRIYSPEVEDRLHSIRDRIVVFELDGPLFFGSTDRLTQEALADQHGISVLVLDFKRVTSLDESGAVVLQWLSGQLRDRDVSMLLAGVTAENRLGSSLLSYGCFVEQPRHDWFADLDQALEAAELLLLGTDTAGFAQRQLHIEKSLLMKGLSAQDRAALLTRLHKLDLTRGTPLFREGDPGDRLYVLTRGSVSVLAARRQGELASQRLVSFSPGAMLGEIALLDGAGRSATAMADTDVTLWVLDREGLDALYRDDPRLCAQLHRNIALQLAERLRAASVAWRESDS